MNADLIELYQGVQKYRGEWRIGDRVHHLIRGPGIVMADHGALGIVDGRKYVGVDFNRPTYAVMPADDPDLLWIAPPTPQWPGDDNRNLWDMVDWEKWTLNSWGCGQVSIVDDELNTITAPLPKALLRAIKEQEADHE